MEATLIFPHQLFHPHPSLAKGRPIYLLEDALFFGPDPHWPLNFHAKKVILHRASMKAYAAQLEATGHQVHYLDCQVGKDTVEVLNSVLPKNLSALHFADPVDDVLTRRLTRFQDSRGKGLSLHSVASPNFLTSPEELEATLGGPKKPFMATFYKKQRQRLKLLVDASGDPEGGQWSFDEENRKKLPKDHPVPALPRAERTDHLLEAEVYQKTRFPEAQGSPDHFPYPVDRQAALVWLDQFLRNRFHLFGDFEDALHDRHRTLFHSVLTPVLNIGLLTPHEVVEKAVTYAKEQKVPLNSTEGFVRQIIGWREFMRGMYLLHGVRERTSNFWNFTRPMPKAFYEGSTGIPPVDEVIKRTLEDGYAHHIERLMIIGNFMLLCRIRPTEVYRWFMELYVDAYDWVMVPNVYGMSQFADGGIFTTKPYLSGSNYVRKMSNYQKGPWCEIWDGLFWTFIADYQEVFAKNARLSRMTWMLNRQSDEKRALHRQNAEAFLHKLDA